MEQKFCQSCAMPMTQADQYGTEKDGSRSADYCSYCYENGAFTSPCTMEEMIDFCAGPMVEGTPGMTKEQAIAAMRDFFPQLKRWQAR